MNLKEANKKLDKDITFDQMKMVEPLYRLMNINEEDFFRAINSIGGIDKLLVNYKLYSRYEQAYKMMKEKEKYNEAKIRMKELEEEMKELDAYMDWYEENDNL